MDQVVCVCVCVCVCLVDDYELYLKCERVGWSLKCFYTTVCVCVDDCVCVCVYV